MKIRDLQLEDVPAFARFLTSLEVAEWTQGRTLPEIATAIEERYKNHGAASTILISTTQEGDISGYGSVHWMPNFLLAGIEGYVSELFIAAEYRGQGIGDSILKEIERMASTNGCHRLSLLNMRDRESYRRGFYVKRNWVERGNAANMIKKFAIDA